MEIQLVDHMVFISLLGIFWYDTIATLTYTQIDVAVEK